MSYELNGRSSRYWMRIHAALVVILISENLSCVAYANPPLPVKGLVPPGDTIFPYAGNHLVHPTNNNNELRFGNWAIDQNQIPFSNFIPNGMSDNGTLRDEGFLQQLIVDDATGEMLVKQIIVGDSLPGETMNEVGMFSETYINMWGEGISMLQGLQCGADTGKCITAGTDYHPLRSENQLSTGMDSIALIRTGKFKDPEEHFRFTQLIYDTEDESKWAEFQERGTTGTTFFSDIFRTTYSIDDVEIGDLTSVITKTQDIDSVYSYSILTAETQFTLDEYDKWIAAEQGIPPEAFREERDLEKIDLVYSRISILSEAETLLQNFPEKFDNINQAADYIERYIQYRVIAQEGWREQEELGLAKQDMFQTTLVGAVVKEGRIGYTKDYLGIPITSEWNDGDRIDSYGADQVILLETDGRVAEQRFGHEVVNPDTCDISENPVIANNRSACSAIARYNYFETTDIAPVIDEREYDPSVGDQFKIEPTDDINPFDPLSTLLFLPEE